MLEAQFAGRLVALMVL